MNHGYWNCFILLALVGGGAGVVHRGEWNALMEMLRLVQLRARISLFPPALSEGPYIPWAVIKYPMIIIREQCVWLRRQSPTSFNILLVVIQLFKLPSDRQVLAPKKRWDRVEIKWQTSRNVAWVTWEGRTFSNKLILPVWFYGDVNRSTITMATMIAFK